MTTEVEDSDECWLDLLLWAVDTSGARAAPCGGTQVWVNAAGGDSVWRAAQLRIGVDLVLLTRLTIGVLGRSLPGLESSR